MKNLLGIVGIFLLIFLVSSCKKVTDTSIKDYDGNIYTSVTIGTQVWMAENLATTKLNNGEAIPLVTDITAWTDLTTSGYCWYDNDESTNKATYGALYNYFTLNTGKLCPTGWHVPTDAEWTTLTTYLNSDTIAGAKLKETTYSHWLTPNLGATNDFNFTALPGGYRDNTGTFLGNTNYGFWWTSTSISGVSSYNRTMSYASKGVGRNPSFVQNGFSIRCVKD